MAFNSLRNFDLGFLFILIGAMYGLFSILYSVACYLLKKSRNIKTPQMGIIILVKDQENFIEGIIRSVACRGFRYGAEDNLLSIVVVDVYSKDQTPQIMQRLAEEYPVLTFLQMAKLSKDISPVEAGLSLCNGEVIWLLDLRGRISPKRAEEIIDYLVNERKFLHNQETLCNI
ncbi:MAG: hypothetical protein PWQ82_1617 [Thermosediminibacterales bacterium]|nr:hypothetical protein [Thermosediminibacterales bacterium]MDK2836294.1 hypothetical protein [Thermosediminibacterales bacterium]